MPLVGSHQVLGTSEGFRVVYETGVMAHHWNWLLSIALCRKPFLTTRRLLRTGVREASFEADLLVHDGGQDIHNEDYEMRYDDEPLLFEPYNGGDANDGGPMRGAAGGLQFADVETERLRAALGTPDGSANLEEVKSIGIFLGHSLLFYAYILERPCLPIARNSPTDMFLLSSCLASVSPTS